MTSASHQPGQIILGLQRAAHATLRMLGSQLTGLQLTGAQINALACLAGGQGLAVGDLARLTGTRPTTLTSVLDRLADQGLIAREIDPADRRSFRISLTPAGRPAAEAVLSAMQAVEEPTLSGVRPADLAGYRAVIDALTRAAERR
ncbi:MAG: MarR family winged helix-turn-helix transcriptional regulator [Streptosporangiaceae bacterium]